ncbi:diguanylate cyclase (GGDEF)-like protein [Melghirimyces profundicolus]|uniref:histidine kinase n=1 Tax=Melghirimyces profundicolus TaxID=1242148 RepID=A0A2T6C2A0_9BACL|nr:ATP-binding protein [Melghirimyces profundicolus]PTX62451.1 diguanylate cyclase (GGDEF)-like protein [Melghirimyces profundicolus]
MDGFQTLDQLLVGMMTGPGPRWVAFGVSLSLAVALLWKRKRWAFYFPFPLYSLIMLGSLAVMDFFTGDLSSLWVYLVVLALLHDRASAEKTVVSTFLFFGVYASMKLENDLFREPYQLAAEAALFGFFAWMSIYLERTNRRSDTLKRENAKLLEKVDEAQSRLHEYIDELEETTRRDYLTGVYNFSGFQEQVNKSLSRCSAADQSYHVVCIDLVDFQQVNMKEGTDAGDQLLMEIARQLKKKLPPYAQVARYDGDQFAIGLMGNDSAMRLCLDTVEQAIDGLRSERCLVNYCLGTASFPLEAQNASELIRLAEHRLSIEQKRIRHREDERRRHLEKLSAVGQLAAGLAHEIRNPLTSIRGFIQISAAESPEVKKWESVILPEIDRINDLLKQFLHLSESRPVRYTLFNLDRLIDDVYQLLNPKAILMGHELIPYPPDSPVIVEADAEQLKQVLINLLQNGLESLNEKGGVSIRWKEMRDRISIRIQDNGSGIPPEHMSRIFDPFFTTKGDGTGMGLSICHRIITEHGGQIHVTSQSGRGTTFNIHLPLRQPSRKGPPSQAGEDTSVDFSLNRSEVVERVNMLKHY